ncbi:MAG TPA: hypothetical protein VMH41_05710 [Mycobacteriales bacterium]|nr:hypothetical protein [Mycobacteriales bacterium]
MATWCAVGSLIIAAAAVDAVVVASPASAGSSYRWSGGGTDGDWSDPANWSSGVAPSGTDVSLDFPATTTLTTPSNVTMVDDLDPGVTVATLIFEGDGYAVSGGSMPLTSAIVSGGDAATVDDPISTDGGQLEITVSPTSTLTLGGAVSGGNGMDIAGSGTVKLDGATSNTNSGYDNVNQNATLVLDKAGGATALAGGLTAGEDFYGEATARWAADDQLPTSSPVDLQVAGSGVLDLNSHSDEAASLILNSGTVSTGSGLLTIDNDIYNNNTSGEISGKIALSSRLASKHTIGEANPNNQLVIGATLTGTGEIDKTGNGTLTLSDACGATGSLVVDAGSVSAPSGYGGSVTQSGGTFSGGTCPGTGPVTNGLIAFDDDAGSHPQVFSITAQGDDSTQLTQDSGVTAERDQSEPAWSPDGTKIAFVSSGHIFVMDADGSNPVDLTPGYGSDITTENPQWTPNGNDIVYSQIDYSDSSPQYDIDEISAEGGDSATNLTATSDASERHPTVNPVNGDIAYERDREIWTMSPDGQDQTPLTVLDDLDPAQPAWSPDGQTIAFQGNEQDIWTDDPSKSGVPTQLTPDDSSIDASRPSWAPDGSDLVISGAVLPDRTEVGLYLVNATTGAETQIPDTTGADDPSWGTYPGPVAATCTTTYTGVDGGAWTTAGNWSNGLPTPTDVACLDGHTVDFNGSASTTPRADAVEDGSLDVQTGTMVIAGADNPSDLGGGSLTIGDGGGAPTFAFDGDDPMTVGNYLETSGTNSGTGVLDVDGDIDWHGGAIGTSSIYTTVNEAAGHTLTIDTATAHYLYDSTLSTQSPVVVDSTAFTTGYDASLTTTSTLDFSSGALVTNSAGGDSTFTAAGLISPNPGPTSAYGPNQDDLELTGGTTTIRGHFRAGAVAIDSGATVIDDGEMDEFDNTTVTGGTLRGTGTVTAIDNQAGTVYPGDPGGAPGTLTTASYSQSGGGTLEIDVASTGNGKLAIDTNNDVVTLNGTLEGNLVGGFAPSSADTVTAMTWPGGTSNEDTTFDTVTGNPASASWSASYDATDVFLTVRGGGVDVATTVRATDPATHATVTQVATGGQVLVTTTIKNQGSAPAARVGLNLTADSGLATVGSPTASAGGSCTPVTGGYSCNFLAIAAGGSATVSETFLGVAAGSEKVTAVAIATGDASTANNTAVDQIAVVAPTGPALAVSAVTGLPEVQQGQQETMKIQVRDTGTASVAGPLSVTVTLPHGSPRGQVIAVAGVGGVGWSCRAVTLTTSTIETCTNSTGISAAHTAAPIAMSLLTSGVQPSSAVAIPVTARAQNVPSPASGRAAFTVTPPGHAAMAITMNIPKSLNVGSSASGNLVLANPGNATLNGGSVVTVTVPAGLDIRPKNGSNWACTSVAEPVLGRIGGHVTSPSMRCAYSAAVTPGDSTTPLPLSVHAYPVPANVIGLAELPNGRLPVGGDASGNDGPRTVTVAGTGSDYHGAVTATTTSTVTRLTTARPSFQVTATPLPLTLLGGSAGAEYLLSVVNQGSGDAIGTVTITEQIPAGYTATVLSFGQGQGTPGWTCSQSGQTLTCTLQASGTGAVIPPGGATPPITLLLKSNLAQSGLLDTSLQGLVGKVASGYTVEGSGIAALAAAGGDSAITINATNLAADKQVGLSLTPATNPLQVGDSSSMTLQVSNSGSTPIHTPVIVGISIPTGMTIGNLPYDPSGVATLGKPSGPAWSCEQVPDSSYPTAATPMLVCQHRYQEMRSPTAVGVGDLGDGSLTIPFTVSQTAPGALALTAGLAVPYADGTLLFGQAITNFEAAGIGQASLTSAQATIGVLGWSANAGKSQTVNSETVVGNAQHETVNPSTVTLDASGTTSPGSPLTYAWRLVADTGGPVHWNAPATGTQPGSSLPSFPSSYKFDGASAPDDWGVRPSFTVAPTHSVQTLTFRVYVTDGTVVHTADTTVTVDPSPDQPPVFDQPPAVTLGPSGHRSTYQAGQAIARLTQVNVGVAAHDPDNDPLSLTAKTSTGLTPLVSGSGVSFVWPSGTARMTVTLTEADGQTNKQGAAVTTSETVQLGTPVPAPALSLSTGTQSTVLPGGTITIRPSISGLGTSDPAPAYAYGVAGQGTCSGTPSNCLGTVAADGSVTLTAPAGTAVGSTITVTGTATSADVGTPVAATASVTIPVAADPLSIAGPAGISLALGASAESFTVTVAGTTSSPSACIVTDSGCAATDAGSSVSASGDTVTFTPPPSSDPADAGARVVRVTVSDSSGQQRSVDVPVTLSLPSAPSPSCGSSDPVDQAIAAISANVPSTITIGAITISLPVGGTTGSCGSGSSDPAQVTFDNATVGFGALQLTGLTGTLTKDTLSLVCGSASFPSSWRIGTASVGTKNCQPTDPATVSVDLTGTGAPSASGTVTFAGIPMLTASSAYATTVTFLGGRIDVDGHTTELASDNKTPLLDVDVSETSFSGPWTIKAAADEWQPFGANTSEVTANGSGSIKSDGTFDANIALKSAVTVAEATIGSGSFDLDNSGLQFSLDNVEIGTYLTLNATGQLDFDSGDWSATMSTEIGSGPSLPGIASTSTSGFSGTLADTEGTFTYDLVGSVSGSNLKLGPFTATGTARAELSNTSKCGSGAQLEVSASGQATLATFTTPTIDADVCVDLSSGHYEATAGVENSTAATGGGGWTPISGLDIDDLQLSFTGTDFSAPDFGLSAHFTAFGVGGVGSVEDIDGSWLFDIGIDLSSIGVPNLGVGHLVYSTSSTDLTVDLPAIPGLSVGEVDGVNLSPGFSVALGIPNIGSLVGPKISGMLSTNLHLNVSRLAGVISGNFAGADSTIRVALKVNVPIMKEPTTQLIFKSAYLQFSTAGTFSVGADVCLDQIEDTTVTASSSATPAKLPSPEAACENNEPYGLDLDAEFSLDLVHLQVTGSMTATNWRNAFGVPGLTLGTLTAQVGFTVGTPVSVTVGFGVTVTRVPNAWCAGLGILPQNCGTSTEPPVTLVVNISATQPVFEFIIGAPPNGTPALEPLRSVDGGTYADALEIYDATLVIAPDGGKVGPYDFGSTPVFDLLFDASIMNTAVHVKAALTLPGQGASTAAWGFDASLSIGAFNVGPVAMTATDLDIELHPATAQFGVLACGGLTIGTGTDAVNTEGRLDAYLVNEPSDFSGKCQDAVGGPGVDTSQGGSGPFQFAFDANVTNLPLGISAGTLPIVTIKSAHLFMNLDENSLDIPTGVQIGVGVDLDVLGSDLQITGAVTLGPLGIMGIYADAQAPKPVPIGAGPATVTFHASPQGASSSCQPAGGVNTSSASAGPDVCLDVDIPDAKFSLHFDGGVKVGPSSAVMDVHGDFGSDDMAVSADFDSQTVGAVAGFSLQGGLFYATDQTLSDDHQTYQVINASHDGWTTVQAHQGDFAVSGSGLLCVSPTAANCDTANPSADNTFQIASMFAANLSPSGLEAQVASSGNFDVFGIGSGFQIVGALCIGDPACTQLGLQNVGALGPVRFDIAATGRLTVAGASLASATIDVNSSGVSVSGGYNIANLLTGSMGGSVEVQDGQITYDITADTNLALSGAKLDLAHTTLTLTNAGSDPTFSGQVGLNVLFVQISGSWNISANNLAIAVTSSSGGLPSYLDFSATYVNGDVGVSASFDSSTGLSGSVSGHLSDGSMTVTGSASGSFWIFSGSATFEASIWFGPTAGISTSGTVEGNVDLGFGTATVGPATLTLQTVPSFDVCGSLDHVGKVCVPSDI